MRKRQGIRYNTRKMPNQAIPDDTLQKSRWRKRNAVEWATQPRVPTTAFQQSCFTADAIACGNE